MPQMEYIIRYVFIQFYSMDFACIAKLIVFFLNLAFAAFGVRS